MLKVGMRRGKKALDMCAASKQIAPLIPNPLSLIPYLLSLIYYPTFFILPFLGLPD